MNNFTKKLLFFLSIFLLNFKFMAAQTLIKGEINDEMDSSRVSAANIVLYHYDTNAIIDFTKSGSNGNFSLKKGLMEGIYTLEVTKIGYRKHSQNIVVGTNEKANIDVKILLNNNNNTLPEVIIKSNSPIIVKKDTIIYRIENFADVHDDNLEKVLTKIPGFKIYPNGDIEVNGKMIRKVLIDGKEVSDLGSGILTRNISPEDVKEIEVRFDEKNEKLKESILDDKKFSVLDIRLKNNLNKSFFGKLLGTVGYQNKLKLGGYSNVFSLNKKFNLQIFGETDQFGDNQISIDQIRNIGEEAMQQIFYIPADFNELKRKQGLHQELYGFKDFVRNDNSIIGISLNYPISNHLELFVGSFNSYSFLGKFQEKQQFYLDKLIFGFNQQSTQKEYNSKNKVQLKLTTDNIKFKTDVNFVHFNNDINILNEVQNNIDHYNYEDKHYSTNFYQNNALEYKLTDKLGIIFNSTFSHENFKHNKFLDHTNLLFAQYLSYSIDKPLFLVNQNNFNKELKMLAELKLRIKTKWGDHDFGYQYNYNKLSNERTSINPRLINPDFVVPQQQIDATIHSLIYSYFNNFGKFTLNTDLELSKMSYPFNRNKTSNIFFQSANNLRYAFDEFADISLTYSKKLAKFPLEKELNGTYLSDFQTVFSPATMIKPFFNENIGLTFFKSLKKWKLDITNGIIYGEARNLDNQVPTSNFIQLNAAQLRNSYLAFSLTLKKSFVRFPSTFTLEPEMINNQSAFVLNNNIYSTKAKRYLLGLKMETKLKKNYDFYFYPKYSNFNFSNDYNTQTNKFEFFSTYVSTKINFLSKTLLTELAFKHVLFFDKAKNTFSNLDIRLTKKAKYLNYNLLISNILNAAEFVTQDFQNAIFINDVNAVFKRFIKFGI